MLAGQRGNFKIVLGSLFTRRFSQVQVGSHQHKGAVHSQFLKFSNLPVLLAGHRVSQILQADHQIRCLQSLSGEQYSLSLDLIGRLTYASRVGQNETQPFITPLGIYGVPGCTRNLSHNGAILSDQCVQQCRFSSIGAPRQYRTNSFADQSPRLVGVQQPVDLPLQVRQKLLELIPIGELHILLNEIEFKLNHRRRIYNSRTKRSHRLSKPPLKLLIRRVDRSSASRMDQIRHRLRLGQLQLAVEKGPLGKFAGFSRTYPLIQNRLQNRLGNQYPSMTGDLYGILSCIGGRAAEKSGQHLVNRLSVAPDNSPEMDGMRWLNCQVFSGEAPLHFLDGLSARNTYNRDSAFTNRCGDRCNGRSLINSCCYLL